MQNPSMSVNNECNMNVICLFFHVPTVVARAPGPTSGGGSRKSRRKQKGGIQPGTDLSEQYRVLRETPTTKKISTTSQEKGTTQSNLY